ncbi:MAG: hypothetical protein AAGC88_04645 [Bacteroidota bacterium]
MDNKPSLISFFFKSLTFPNKEEATANDSFWKGASIGVILLVSFVAIITAFNSSYGIAQIWIVLIAMAALVTSVLIFPILSMLVVRSVRLYPSYFIGAMGGAIGVLIVLKNIRFGIPNEFFYYGGALALVATAMLFGAFAVLISGKLSQFNALRKIAVVVSLFLGLGYLSYAGYWLLREGTDPYPVDFVQKPIDPKYHLNLEDPSTRGQYQFSKFTYGSGVNRMRPEFGEDVDHKSETVSGKYILPTWTGEQAEKRSWYWGFGVDEWPLNGIAWMPEGEGPFPVVLIVHGNHGMEEYSDPGYEYLGELLASRGYLTISVDENYINGSWAGDFRGRELPARAWLLLKHLEQWRNWNIDSSHPLSGKADLNRVSLIGHSRGGEAVPIAAAFNTLSAFPDDSREQFDFNFGIQSVIAIAPTDYRYDRRVRMENVDFLGIQGSYDSDEDSFFGLRQLQRTDFTDSTFHMKTGVYVHGANHGQFNSIWGRNDSGFPGKLFLNTEPMISGEDQRKYAEVLIGAFLEVTLKDNLEYASLFKDLRSGDGWLPENTLAISLYEDNKTRYWADFEEDIELSTTGAGSVSSTGFDVWAEDYLQYRAGRHQENHALVLGWKQDSIAELANYTISFEDSTALLASDLLTLSIGSGNPSLLKDVKEDSLWNDIAIKLTDASGQSVSTQLSDYKLVAPRLKIRYLKTKSLTTSRYRNEWEPVLESVFIPIADYADQGLNISNLRSITLEANTSKSGLVLVDRIGVVSGAIN